MATQFLNTQYVQPGQLKGLSERKLYLADLPNITSTNGRTDISRYITQLSVNYTMDMASQLSFDIVDVDLKMAQNNYFILGRDVIYETQTISSFDSITSNPIFVNQLFEIANVSSSQGPGGSVTFNITCYTKAVQQMKRDKKSAASINGQGTAFVREAAKRYGLKFYGQETTKKQKINKAGGDKQAESLWNVLQNLAGDAKFVLYEIDGYLVFASEQWLLYKWGIDSRTVPKFVKKNGRQVRVGNKTERWMPLQFPNSGAGYVGRPGVFKLTEHPTITKSENDPYAASGTCTVERVNATQLRPGMTVYVGLVPNMSGYYLIESVSFNELVPDPVSVSFRTPTRDEEKEKPKLLPVGARYKQTFTSNPPGDFSRVTGVTGSVVSSGNKPKTRPLYDPRLEPFPSASSPLSYPSMPKANMTSTLKSFKYLLGSNTNDSTNDVGCVHSIGNMNLWNRPVIPTGSSASSGKAATIEHIIVTFESGGTWYAGIVPTVWTVNGSASLVSESEITTYIDSVGRSTYFLTSGKHLGVLTGSNSVRASLNARDYAYLINRQQEDVLINRFPEYSGTPWLIPNTGGATDSIWPIS
jgi:hypothetical protein